MIEESLLVDVVTRLIKRSATTLPSDVKDALKRALDEEGEELAKRQLEAIVENVEVAEREQLPVCQDTGLICLYVDLDPSICDPLAVERAAVKAARRATQEVPLRPNVVHPLTRHNTGDNVGLGQPYVEYSFNREGYVKLTVLLKGAGSENMTKLSMLPPLAGLEGIVRFVVDSVVEAGGAPCPPLVLGVGVGGVAEEALRLAKASLLRPIGRRGGCEEAAKLEALLLEAVNSTGLGCMGLGGRVTALDVHVELAYCHTASLPVAIAFQCWALRRASAKLTSKGEVTWLS